MPRADTGIDPAAIGTDVRLGLSGRENYRTKGVRYLTQGRLIVRAVMPGRIVAFLRGDSGSVHRVGFDRDWYCSCPAKGPCSHLHALKHVVVDPTERQT